MKETQGYFRKKLCFLPRSSSSMLCELAFGSIAPPDRCIGHAVGCVQYESDQLKVCLDAQQLSEIWLPIQILMVFFLFVGVNICTHFSLCSTQVKPLYSSFAYTIPRTTPLYHMYQRTLQSTFSSWLLSMGRPWSSDVNLFCLQCRMFMMGRSKKFKNCNLILNERNGYSMHNTDQIYGQ